MNSIKQFYIKNTKILVITIILFIVLIAGITYAYFEKKIFGNDKSSSIVSNTANLVLSHTGIITTSGSIRRPGDSMTQTFTIKNVGNEDINTYNLYFTKVINTFSRREDLTYTLTCVSSNGACQGKDETVLPYNDDNAILVAQSNIGVGVTHTYSITFNYKEAGVDQSVDMGKEFSAYLLLPSAGNWYDFIGVTIVEALPEHDVTNSLLLFSGKEYTLLTLPGYNLEGTYLHCPGTKYSINGNKLKIYSSVSEAIGVGSCKIVAAKNYEYKGEFETFIAPLTGKYKLEVWGAQGGNYSDDYTGGTGGYSNGIIYLNKGETLNIYVGGQPKDISNTPGVANAGGFNGGGAGKTYLNSYTMGAGGATDIRYNNTSLDYRIIVAGGGSGATDKKSGYAGGGLSSIGGSDAVIASQIKAGTGGSLGIGASSIGTASSKYGACAGGGGFYGGGSYSASSENNTDLNNCAGGSGYIYTKNTVNSLSCPECLDESKYLDKARTYDGKATFTSPYSENEKGHTGNGYARISFMGNKSLVITVYNGTLSDADIINESVVYLNSETKLFLIPDKGYYLYKDKMVCKNETYEIGSIIEVDERLFDEEECSITLSNEMKFAYSGNYEEVIVPASGYYQIEAWGAQGGQTLGANGGYTRGTIYLNKDDKLYVYVGQKLDTSNSTSFNGGTVTSGAPGGGATDIRYFGEGYTPTATELTWNNITGLRSRIMTAGGGGAGTALGGAGGGLYGLASGAAAAANGKGGTQTAGGALGTSYTAGSFGVGGNGCGGGGGYYGGGGAACASGGGGGSSFISGYAGVNAVISAAATTATNNTKHYSGKYFINATTIVGNEEMPNPNGGTMTGNSGNGYAKITYLGETTLERTNTKLNNVRYIKSCLNGSSASAAGHWVELQAIKDGVNVAKGKTVTGTSTQNATYVYSRLTDGIIDYATYVTPSATTGLQCLTVDLGDTYNLDEVALWVYWAAADRIYYDNTLSVGDTNPGNTTTTFLSTILHSYSGTVTSQGKHYTVWD